MLIKHAKIKPTTMSMFVPCIGTLRALAGVLGRGLILLPCLWLGPALASDTADDALEAVFKLEPNLENGKRLYRLCAACHGQVGFGALEGEFPAIAGQHQRVLVKQLLDVRTKKRINPSMFPFVDAQTLGGNQGLADVSAYVAALPINPNPIKGSGEMVAKGKELYEAACIGCHGATGEGNATTLYPLLQGQHYTYLVREISWIKDKIRKNGNPEMVAILQSYEEADILAVADYITTLKP